MSNHLSQDEKARWLSGQSRPEEEAHVRQCDACASDLAQFRNAMSTFRTVMNEWSEDESVPILQSPAKPAWVGLAKIPAPAWALVAAFAAGLVILPAYWHTDNSQPDEPPVAEPTNSDVVLMEAVAAHLARPVPAPMERVLLLLPDEDAAYEIDEREELR